MAGGNRLKGLRSPCSRVAPRLLHRPYRRDKHAAVLYETRQRYLVFLADLQVTWDCYLAAYLSLFTLRRRVDHLQRNEQHE